MPIKTFSPTLFRSNSSRVFNSVQEDGAVFIESKSRPDMVLMLSSERNNMLLEIKRLEILLGVANVNTITEEQLDLLK